MDSALGSNDAGRWDSRHYYAAIIHYQEIGKAGGTQDSPCHDPLDMMTDHTDEMRHKPAYQIWAMERVREAGLRPLNESRESYKTKCMAAGVDLTSKPVTAFRKPQRVSDGNTADKTQ